jgi:chemotaxis protein MotA
MNLIFGILVVIGCLAGGYIWEGGHPMALFQPAELLIIGGAGIGAFLISNPGRTLRECFHSLPRALKGSHYDLAYHMDALALMYTLLAKVRKDGMISIEIDVEELGNSSVFSKYPKITSDVRARDFICDYFRIIVTGNMNSYEIENLMDLDLDTASHSARKPAEAFTYLAESLPAFGIVAAVMGVVITMAFIGGPPEELGHKVAAALVGTFLGILLAYGFLGPIAKLLQNLAEEEEQFFACLKTCIVAYLNGYPPKTVIEFGRMAMAPDIRPSFREVENYCAPRR